MGLCQHLQHLGTKRVVKFPLEKLVTQFDGSVGLTHGKRHMGNLVLHPLGLEPRLHENQRLGIAIARQVQLAVQLIAGGQFNVGQGSLLRFLERLQSVDQVGNGGGIGPHQAVNTGL